MLKELIALICCVKASSGFSTTITKPKHIQSVGDLPCKKNNRRSTILFGQDGSEFEDEVHKAFAHKHIKRRQLFQKIFAFTIGGWATTTNPSLAWSVKGAAEYDLEYYFRDLFLGNQPQGNQPASPPPPSFTRPPRILKEPLFKNIDNVVPSLLDSDCLDSIVVQELVSVAQKLGKKEMDASLISQLTQTYRSRAIRNGYGAFRPFKTPSVNDEYFLDVTAYALWKTAASEAVLGSNYEARNKFARNFGYSIYSSIKKQRLLPQVSKDFLKHAPLTGCLATIEVILELFKESNFIVSYRLGPSEYYANNKNIQPLFDRYDDQDFLEGATLNALISVFEPATLGAALQVTGEGSRFAPDFIGCTIAAAFEDLLGKVDVSYETYFVDSTYRPNPKDYFPDEQLLQFSITSK